MANAAEEDYIKYAHVHNVGWFFLVSAVSEDFVEAEEEEGVPSPEIIGRQEIKNVFWKVVISKIFA